MTYWIIIIVSMVIGFATQAFINSSYKKYARVSNSTGMTGAQIARRMLDDNGLQNVPVQRVAGTLTDHYDPSSRVVRLSEGIYDSASVSAMAVACHECGHAVQHARSYVPMSIRSALVPIANFGSSAWLVLLIIGIFLNMMSLVWAGIILYAFAVLFHVVTLPVEFNASRRGLTYIGGDRDSNAVTVAVGLGAVPEQVNSGAHTVLIAAALTYVAAALTSVMQLLYFIGVAQNQS
ncbi:MAG: zinc metallopeptidase [Coriobacteriales bacterium]|jgi:Zn-dependent membrane protease YugP